MNSRLLTASDIVGKTIRKVLRSRWDEDTDGIAACRVFVELSEDLVFELAYQDPFDILPFQSVHLQLTNHFPVDDPAVRACQGSIVLAVATSDYWPAPGLLLSNAVFLLVSDIKSPGRVGPCAVNVGEFYELEDAVDYWTHSPLAAL